MQYISVSAKVKQSELSNIPSGETPSTIISAILNIVYMITAAIAVIIIIAAGIMYMTSDGDAQKTKKKKRTIIYALIGLLIIGSAFIITGVIQWIAN